MDAEQFERELRAQGYGEPEALEYPPNMAKEMHTHDKSCFVLVLGGELTLVTEEGATTYRCGDTCKIASGTLHAEQTGASGLKALLGKR